MPAVSGRLSLSTVSTPERPSARRVSGEAGGTLVGKRKAAFTVGLSSLLQSRARPIQRQRDYSLRGSACLRHRRAGLLLCPNPSSSVIICGCFHCLEVDHGQDAGCGDRKPSDETGHQQRWDRQEPGIQANQHGVSDPGKRVPVSTITEPRPYQNEVKLAYPNKRTTFKSNAVRMEGTSSSSDTN